MALPDPKPGLVIRYDYLWTREAAAGREQDKDRPLSRRGERLIRQAALHRHLADHTRAPTGDTIGIEIPAKVRSAIGLDEAPSWVIVSEHNIDEWPNGGLSPSPGRPELFSYGFLPPGLFASIKAAFLDLAKQGRSGGVRR